MNTRTIKDSSLENFDALLAKHNITYNRGWGWVGNGWHPLLDEMFTKLTALGWDREMTQVKEKFGQLRVYIGEATNEMWQVVHEAERKSAKVCEECGQPGRPTGGGWVRTACTTCVPDDEPPQAA